MYLYLSVYIYTLNRNRSFVVFHYSLILVVSNYISGLAFLLKKIGNIGPGFVSIIYNN